jgi:hypothetical protein
MSLPGFNAEASLGKLTRTYRARYIHGGLPQSPSGIAANVGHSQLEATEGLEDSEEAELMEEMDVEGEMDAEGDIDVEETEMEGDLEGHEEA